MKAFLDSKEVQEKYLNRIRKHAKADEFAKGIYWENGKGCAVGCTVHSSDHSDYETELGIPKWVAKLEDRIFEGLPNARAKLWPVEFLESVNIGSDLNKIKIPMLIFIVESARETTKNERSLRAIDKVLVEFKKDIIDLPKLIVARDAACAAAAYAAADEYAKSLLNDAGYILYHTLMPETISHLLAGAKHQKELSDAREKLLLDVIGELKIDLETISEHCICKRNTFGFDYHEDHLYLGKPKSGSRWLTPFDIIKSTLSSAAKKLEGL